ncbi:hypothetical protein [Chryseobacterium gallinarum]|uniref:Uncharacterized protein n=1 Tax=Chryseobacterium gallinarum TaxID=1324352 RepID=A0ABX6KQK4_CHRGL|nr:hypothetical protein [Chryseobacterium gallinarum]QIY90083.1 hypothetical protein FOB44_05155 [Chryseobacterium gallinarum]
MKKNWVLISTCICSFYLSQVKVNTGNDIEIILLDSNVSMQRYLDGANPYKYKIINHTDHDYIIDPQGFVGKTYVYENDKLYNHPEKMIPQGYYSRDLEDCKADLLLVKKRDSLITQLDILNINFYYKIRPSEKYNLDIQSKHNEYTVTLLGCSNYIKSLKLKGYKVFTDKINVKLSLKP